MHVTGYTKQINRLMRGADFFIGKSGSLSIAEAMLRQLPVVLESNARTLPQERYNIQWVKENKVGVILKNFKDIVSGVKELLINDKLAEYRAKIATLNNRAVFEVPEIFSKLFDKHN
jgi:UDP-N-acetylglucosamine:LPS N-acetylglucosamine transferase